MEAMLLIRQRSQLEDRYQLQPTALPEHPWPFTRQVLKDYLQGLGLEPRYYDLRPIGPWHPMALEAQGLVGVYDGNRYHLVLPLAGQLYQKDGLQVALVLYLAHREDL